MTRTRPESSPSPPTFTRAPSPCRRSRSPCSTATARHATSAWNRPNTKRWWRTATRRLGSTRATSRRSTGERRRWRLLNVMRKRCEVRRVFFLGHKTFGKSKGNEIVCVFCPFQTSPLLRSWGNSRMMPRDALSSACWKSCPRKRQQRYSL